MINKENLTGLVSLIDDSLNPILVKELCQTVRGKFFWGIFGLFLVSLTLVFLNLLTSNSQLGIDGREIAMMVLICLSFASFLIIPLKLSNKLSNESKDATNELLRITTMTPESIFMGKFFSGVVIIFMLFCAVVPFLSLTLFTGGVEPIQLISVTIFLFISSIVGVVTQIAAGFQIANAGGMRVVLKFISYVMHFILWTFVITWGRELFGGHSGGIGVSITVIIIFLVSCFVVSKIVKAYAVSYIAPDTSNSSKSIRKWLTCAWFISAVVATTNLRAIEIWCVIIGAILAIFAIAVQTEPENYSERIIEEIPSNNFLATILFPYYKGVMNGLVWVYTIWFFTALLTFLLDSYTEKEIALSLLVVVSGTIYGLLGNFIRKKILRNPKRSANGVVGGILAAVFFLGTLYFVNELRVDDSSLFGWFCYLVNPVCNCLVKSRFATSALILAIYLLIAVCLNYKAVFGQIADYYKRASSYKEDRD